MVFKFGLKTHIDVSAPKLMHSEHLCGSPRKLRSKLSQAADFIKIFQTLILRMYSKCTSDWKYPESASIPPHPLGPAVHHRGFLWHQWGLKPWTSVWAKPVYGLLSFGHVRLCVSHLHPDCVHPPAASPIGGRKDRTHTCLVFSQIRINSVTVTMQWLNLGFNKEKQILFNQCGQKHYRMAVTEYQHRHIEVSKHVTSCGQHLIGVYFIL